MEDGSVENVSKTISEYIKVEELSQETSAISDPFLIFINGIERNISELGIFLEDQFQRDPVSKSFTCNYCGQYFNCKTRVKQHVSNIHANVSINCKQCDKRHKTMESFRMHNKCHNELQLKEQPNEIPIKKKSNGELQITKPTNEITTKKESNDLLTIIINDSEVELSSFSDMIDKSYFYDESLRYYKCKTCEYMKTSKGNIIGHFSVHMQNMKIFCNLCDKAYKTMTMLCQHMKMCHEFTMTQSSNYLLKK